MSGACPDEVCITCSDQLLALVVTATDAAARTARGSIDGTVVDVSTDLVDRVAVGDVLLCHGGVALQHGAPVDVLA
ncbi:MAG TPA: HypC/HybG/HupF family hydrogenase formation chaperone [Candidatus Saccharimonadales bacterium]|nr:HypC/HybG/HupF family hydrogenase formation chaperone [Candidatus Saccharimonadales bacterium]